jgi:hypothetical protein
MCEYSVTWALAGTNKEIMTRVKRDEPALEYLHVGSQPAHRNSSLHLSRILESDSIQLSHSLSKST